MKPGIKTIIAGGLALMVGAFVVPALVVYLLIFRQPHETQFKVPGTIEIAITEAGRYYLWNDFRTIYQGRSYDQSETVPNGLEIQIRDAGGRPLRLVSDASISSSSDGREKKSIGYVEVDQPGKLMVQVSGGNEERIFSFSQFRLSRILGIFAGGISLALFAAAGGLGLLIYGIVKLVRSNRAFATGGSLDGGPVTTLK